MSVQIEVIPSQISKLLELERQMTHLLALRRALCLLNAKRDRPNGSRRRIRHTSGRYSVTSHPSSAETLFRVSKTPQRIDWKVDFSRSLLDGDNKC